MLGLFRKKQNIFNDLGPQFHDFSFFGVQNDQIPDNLFANQKCKFPILLSYISQAIAKSKRHCDDPVSFTELFCADGFYTMIAAKLGCSKSIGIDSNKDNFLTNSEEIARRLKLPNVTFLQEEISPDSHFTQTDIVANIGGLYHVDKPKEVLEMSYTMANKFLIVQNVVSLAQTDENYFESPAPGWNWGNRFSRESFDKMIRGLGYDIIDHFFNELEGNDRPEDMGSVYYLIRKKPLHL